ncbi:helix-turn-helix domain-containing protein, partial [Roseomonas sp. E05]|uniref:helix-turn-helix domain-containing protein n=1 Tax=Roseomonas sp. E05 TaxID=3046310 RepID=UPI0024B9D353
WPAAPRSCAARPDFSLWRRGWLRAGRLEPALLAAAEGAASWMRQAGEGDTAAPQLQQALFLAAVLLRRRGRLRHVPLVFWSAGRRGMRHPAEDPAGWPRIFLQRVHAAALRSLDEIDRLQGVAAKGATLVSRSRRSSALGAACELALRHPVLTAGTLATRLGLTHQGALLVLNRLVAEGVVREVTGRASFRAYAA